MPAAGHFCPHGNLRYSCAKCRAERQAKRAPPKRQTYGRPLGPSGKIPARPWTLEEALRPHEQAAVQAMSGKDGVVSMPAVLGLRRVAYTLLRALRHDADSVLFVVPSARALEAWSDALETKLHVPAEELDASGRAVRDWQRLPTVVLWTPEMLLRNKSGLRQHAPRLALFVDSPESDAYSDAGALFALPFERRVGVTSARLGPVDPTAYRGLDGLGGLVHHLSVRDAIRDGLLRDVRHQWIEAPTDDLVGPLLDAVQAATTTGRTVVHVGDAETGRRLEEAAGRQGIEARLVADAASPEGAARAARAVSEGNARLLVRTAGAPPTPLGAVDVVVHADPDAGPMRRAHADLAAMAAGARRLHIIDLLPARAPGPDGARRLAERASEVRHSYAGRIPAQPWLLAAFPVAPLDAATQAAVAARAPEGWHAVLGLLPDLLADGRGEGAAVAALADAHIAVALDAPHTPLGPPASDPAALLVAHDTVGLPSLALLLPETRDAFATVLAKDLARFLDAYAAAPLLHHLAPDPRALLIATLETVRAARVPTLPHDPVAAAEMLLRRGAPLPASSRFEGAPPPRPLNAEPHMERLLEALEAEKTLETEESVHEIAQLTPHERQRQGRTLLGLELVGKQRTSSGLALRYALPAGRGGARAPLPYTELSPGALVDLTSGDQYDPLGRGTVSALDAYELTVLVEEDRERRAPGKEARIDLVGNPRIYDLLARAVRLVYGPGGLAPGSGPGGLKEHLLERAAPQNPERVTLDAFDPHLDPSQRAAVGACLGSRALALVHGPPGTGKTTTLVEFLLQETVRGHRVLVTADSNAAVDTIMDAFLRAGGVGVRTGPRPSLTRPHLAPYHVDHLRGRAPGIDWLARLPVVFTTHVSSASLPSGLTFDLVVQDEASQATEPASCASLVRAPRLVLAGDHLQLPPVVRSQDAERLGLKVSLFERLHDAYGDTLGHLLSVQYRMHGDIERWSNEEFYDGRIETAVDPPPVAAAVQAGLLPESPRALFADVAGAEQSKRTSKERQAEAEWIDTYVRRLLKSGVRPEQIAVIAAYRAQVRLLRRLLDGTSVDIGTIDAFQGSERDLVIVSLVRGNPKGEVGFVREPRRLNVAMTRAKRHLVVVGHRTTLEQAPLLRRLIARLAPL